MTDRLEEIKHRYDWFNKTGDFFYEAVTCGDALQRVKDFAWLIKEVDRVNKAHIEVIRRVEAAFDPMIAKIDKAIEAEGA